ncbi:MAG: carboxyl transferase domain-containing protein [Candidatus Binatia bacterium]|nr:carboxyl transferase domain-containing protein [Candidatus Binatia bacterium]MDG2009796.1 carboxyl transferase domain-containing protein [Candidatus Binatia bacterium]
MSRNRILIANRGEIALRILRASEELGWEPVVVYTEDESESLPVARAAQAVALPGTGPAPYLDATMLAKVAADQECAFFHPGYGFLSESADLARACADAGVNFVGPTPATLETFGDKAAARALALKTGLPCLEGTSAATTLAEAEDFLAGLGSGGAVLIKAMSGGGGRGMRVVRSPAELPKAWKRCASEARRAFGVEDLYVERFLAPARHIEIQVAADRHGELIALGERECSIQRNHQKLVEVAPSPTLSPKLREELSESALDLARAAGLSNLATVEFLVAEGEKAFFFIEANARLQVEHTVTEEVFGVDLVRAQLAIAAGSSLAELGLPAAAAAGSRGHAIQFRVNMERLSETGQALPSPAQIISYEPPSGPGIRVDAAAYAGWTPSASFDSLLAKLVVVAPGPYANVVRRAQRALSEFRVEGPDTSLPFLRALAERPEFVANQIHTRFLEEKASELLAAIPTNRSSIVSADSNVSMAGEAGTALASEDPLAVLEHGRQSTPSQESSDQISDQAAGEVLAAPLQGTILQVDVAPGDTVAAGARLFVMEAMKMEHEILAPRSGAVREVDVSVGDAVLEGRRLARLIPGDIAAEEVAIAVDIDPEKIRPDLAEVRERHSRGLDSARPEKVAKRHQRGQRTARENLADLCDPNSFLEYGALAIAAQRARRSVEDLMTNTPADGLVCGVGSVNGEVFAEERARCAVLSYDYMVLAGTQGLYNHRKKDRIFEVAAEANLPVVFFTEGGGGRPGDTDGTGITGLDCLAFQAFAALSGQVPLVGLTTGRCFAGNAALLGCCDVTIATKASNIGMGGPAMIEGGGLGVFRPEEVGPASVQSRNGVIDILVEDEAEAVAAAKKYLGYFQGSLDEWSSPDQRRLRHLIPENRLRIYDVREVIDGIADTDSVLELRREFGPGMVTAFARVEGRPLGIVANNPVHLAGAIDADGADKAARFLQLCDAFDLPVLMLCDTPGIMVGPAAEEKALVRHASRLFVTGASLQVPLFTVVLRKGYGLGAQAMAGGSFRASLFTVAWPTGEFGGMGLEGAVKLGFRKELEAIEDPAERKRVFEERVARMYEFGKATSVATALEIDGVIDPAETRHWLCRGLATWQPPRRREGKKRPFVDTW